MVLKAGASVEELYQFQVSRLPGGDPDERIKLAKWCLTEKMIPQAREQLEAVKEMCPTDAEVQRMLYNLAATQADRPGVDPELRRTSAEVPGTLDPGVLRRPRKFTGLPQIFDLPPAQAVKRANEFAEFVQPVLQQSCVKCHNEKYDGGFQLVEARTLRDRTNTDILRANLDATLRLVNQDDPSRSELLSAGLVPHGGNRNAIFKGPNDQGYMILVTWIKKVRPTAPVSSVSRTPNEANGRSGFNSAEPAGGDSFAADRTNRPNSSPAFPTPNAGSYPPLPGGNYGMGQVGPTTQIPQSNSTINNYQESAEFVRSAGDNPQFTAPFVIGGAPAVPPAPTRTRTRPGATGGPAKTPDLAQPTGSTQLARPIGPNAAVVGPADTLRELPGMDKPLYPTPPSKDEPANPDAPPVAKKKPKKIDNALLEQVMKNRNGGATPGEP
jgi:hypothetical protein